MKLEHWMQLLFGVVVVGALGFFGTNIFDLKGIMNRVDTKVDLTDRRLSRIAEVLPEVKARVAWEEVNNKMSGFVATSVPEEVRKNMWKTYVKLYNARKNSLKVYSLTLDENHKDFMSYVVAGKVRMEGVNDPSFMELASYSSELKESTTIPTSINPSTSFALRKSDIESYEKYLAHVTGSTPVSLNSKQMRNWKDVASQLPALEKQLAELKEKEESNE